MLLLVAITLKDEKPSHIAGSICCKAMRIIATVYCKGVNKRFSICQAVIIKRLQPVLADIFIKFESSKSGGNQPLATEGNFMVS